MMEFVVEMVITAFAFGGILGAVVALHLSANLKSSAATRPEIELAGTDEEDSLTRLPIKLAAHRTGRPSKRQR